MAAQWHTIFEGVQDADFNNAAGFSAPFYDYNVIEIPAGYNNISRVEVTRYAETFGGSVEGDGLVGFSFEIRVGATSSPYAEFSGLRPLGLITEDMPISPAVVLGADEFLNVVMGTSPDGEGLYHTIEWRRVRIFAELLVDARWTNKIKTFEVSA